MKEKTCKTICDIEDVFKCKSKEASSYEKVVDDNRDIEEYPLYLDYNGDDDFIFINEK